jgi:FkbM family methyltransferase
MTRFQLGAAVRRYMELAGFEISRIDSLRANTMRAALARRLRAGLQVNTIVDVGASDGSWSRMARRFFPSADCLLIEANRFHEPRLLHYAKEHGVNVVHAAASDVDGVGFFDFSDPYGGLASHTPEAGYAEVPTARIDTLVRRFGLRPPFLLKLDTHGFEVPILRGAKEILPASSLLVIEAYNFRIAPEALRFHEMCSWLESAGFRTIDIVDPMRRPGDGAFWQLDLVFAPSANREFERDEFV